MVKYSCWRQADRLKGNWQENHYKNAYEENVIGVSLIYFVDGLTSFGNVVGKIYINICVVLLVG